MADIDFRMTKWDRMEDIPSPGEHPHVFGHDKALEMLSGQYHSGRFHHAWLISGPGGIGKATFSLAMAGHILRNPDAALAPQNFVRPEPGDVTASKIAKGGHPNLLHLSRPYDHKTKKFKSAITVDEIRRTLPFFSHTSGQDNWRICIIDSADDMNANAANALLKILEEPPERTVFFVLANSPGRLLPTLRSRCRQLPLRPLDDENMEMALDALGTVNGPVEVNISGLDDENKQLLWRLSAGSVRRALVLLQQDGMKMYQRFEEVLGQGRSPNWQSAHQLADEVSRQNKQEQYRLLLDIARDYISDAIHNGARANNKGGSGGNISVLAQMSEVWEKTAHSAALTDSYNLDKKQVILNLFGSLAKVR